MRRVVLLTPGPSPVPDEVLKEIGQPLIHHRTEEYKKILEEVFDSLKKVFFTQRPVLIFSSSGTGAMEAAVSNFINSKDKVLVIEGGKFGQRWTEILQAYKVSNVVKVEVEWGKTLPASKLQELINVHKDVRAVFATLCETSTGTLFDIKGYGDVIKKRETLLIVDAISGLLSDPLYMDEWNVDVVVCGSQKGMMLPPGLSFLSFSQKAESFLERSDLPHYYFDVKKYKKSLDNKDTPFTSSVSLIRGLHVALKTIIDFGVENMFKKSAFLAETIRKIFVEAGFTLFSEYPSNAVSSIVSPVDSIRLIKTLRSRFGVSIAGGQAHLKGKIFRVAHMGYINEQDLLFGMLCLDKVLREMGFNPKCSLASKLGEVLNESSNY